MIKTNRTTVVLCRYYCNNVTDNRESMKVSVVQTARPTTMPALTINVS